MIIPLHDPDGYEQNSMEHPHLVVKAGTIHVTLNGCTPLLPTVVSPYRPIYRETF